MTTGARTLAAAYGAGTALKAGGWNGGYLAAAEILPLDCRIIRLRSKPGETLRRWVGRADIDAGCEY